MWYARTRHESHRAHDFGPYHNRQVLAAAQARGKVREITAIPKLLAAQVLKGTDGYRRYERICRLRRQRPVGDTV